MPNPIYENEYGDEALIHRDSGEEISFLNHVASGDMNACLENCSSHRFLDSTGVGMLSTDPLLNMKYHMVITAALITRKCIASGLEPEKAFRMSDYYIRKLDTVKTISEIEDIHNNMVLDFTGKMRLIHRDKGFSRSISKCIEYIYAHIYERITVNDLSEYTKVSASFLSREFSKELGQSISDYIREKKIEVSQDLLRTTDTSILDIAYQLHFSSQSHFIQTFKNIVGVTPRKYREINSYHTWDD